MKTLYVDLSVPRLAAVRALGGASRTLGRLSRRLDRTEQILFGPLAPLREADITPGPLPGSRYVRVRNRLAGICGSDLHFVLGEGDPRIGPAALPGRTRSYMGHEIVGDVVEVGAEVRDFKVGDRVAQHRSGESCLAQGRPDPCRHCVAGNYALCERPAEEGEDRGVGGGWSEEWVTPEGRLFRVPDDLTDEEAVLIEPAGSAVRAALRHRPKAGDRVLVIGMGTQGLIALQAVRAIEPDCRVAVLARFPYQGDMARRFGASDIIMLGSDAYAEVARLTGGHLYKGVFGTRMILGGFDVVYDCVGKPSTLRDALRWTRAGGTVVLLGVELAPMHIDLTPVWYQEVDLIGVIAHGMEEWEGERISTFDLIVKWLREGKLNFDGLITHRFPLSEYRQAIMTAIDQPRTHSIKVVLDHRAGASQGR